MPKNAYGVDVNLALRNIAKEGIPLTEVTIFYDRRDLTGEEINLLEAEEVITNLSETTVFGKCTTYGKILLPDKVRQFYYLGS